MDIRTATFARGVTGPDELLKDGKPHIVFIGRSNVGKSSTINALTKTKGLAKSSGTPGRTRELNVFLINKALYFIDFPGYGFSRSSKAQGDVQERRIEWYLFDSSLQPSLVVLIVDAKVGVTALDQGMLSALAQRGHRVLVVANKVDRLKPMAKAKQLAAIGESASGFPVLPVSAEKRIGIGQLGEEIERSVALQKKVA